MNCFSAYREPTNYSNKFHVTFHPLWGSIGSSCCTMLECPPLWVEETPLGYKLNDVASAYALTKYMACIYKSTSALMQISFWVNLRQE